MGAWVVGAIAPTRAVLLSWSWHCQLHEKRDHATSHTWNKKKGHHTHHSQLTWYSCLTPSMGYFCLTGRWGWKGHFFAVEYFAMLLRSSMMGTSLERTEIVKVCWLASNQQYFGSLEPHRMCIFPQAFSLKVIVQHIASSGIFGWCHTILSGPTLGCVLLWSSQHSYGYLFSLCRNTENPNVVESTNHTPAPGCALAMWIRIRQHPPSQLLHGMTRVPAGEGYTSILNLVAV